MKADPPAARADKLPLGWICCVGVVLLFAPFARLGVDPHHDGIMLRPALVVSGGGVIHRDAFSQYGPMSAWVQSIGVLVFGPTLFAIRLTTVLSLGAAAGMFAASWSREYGRGIAMWAVGTWVLLTPFFSVSTPMHPWSSDICLAFQAATLTALVHGVRRERTRAALALCALGGVFAAAATMARLNVGVALVGIVGLLLLATRRWSLLACFTSGAAVTTLAATVYLGANGALDDWWEQTILLPRMWLDNVIGNGGREYIVNRVTHVAIPGFVVLTLVVAAVVLVHRRTSGRRRIVVAGVVGGFALAIATVLAYGHDDLPYWNRTAAFWSLALAGVVVPAVAIAMRGVNESEFTRLLAWGVGVASLVQIYPVAEARHLWWSVLPVLGPLGAAAVSLTRGAGARTIAVASCLALLPFAGQSGRETVRTKRVSLPDSPVLDHMLMDADNARYFATNLRAVQRYVEAHDNPPIFNVCADGLFAALSPNLDAPDPWFVFWPAPKPLDDAKRGAFIIENRPIAWLCPPSPDPDQIARGWNYRLLPQDPALAGNSTATQYPFTSTVAVPAEWPALEGAIDDGEPDR